MYRAAIFLFAARKKPHTPATCYNVLLWRGKQKWHHFLRWWCKHCVLTLVIVCTYRLQHFQRPSLLFASPHCGFQKLTSPWRCLSLKDVCHSSEVCVCLRASQTPQLLLDWWLRCHSYAHKLTLALNHIQLYCKVHIGACITCEPKVFTNAVSRECHPHPNPYKKYTKYMDFLLVL